MIAYDLVIPVAWRDYRSVGVSRTPLHAAAEQQLVAQLCQGEAQSYRQLYDSYAPRLQRILERVYRDPQLALDAVQSTFLIVFQKIDQFDGRSSLLTWITRIGIREAQRHFRANARGSRMIDATHPGGPADPERLGRSPEQEHANRELYRQMEALIAALPTEKRTALLLFEVEGFSVQEIADITGEPRGTVLARLSRTRAELREALSRWSDAGTAAKAAPMPVKGQDYVHEQ